MKIGQDCPGLNFSFDNADDAQDENADYVVECSGEFPTAKQAEAADLEGLVVTPFIRYMNCMKTDDSKSFKMNFTVSFFNVDMNRKH